jgi:hypothetical protein
MSRFLSYIYMAASMALWPAASVNAGQSSSSTDWQPAKIQTESLKMTGKRPAEQPQAELSAGFTTKTIQTEQLSMSGKRPEAASSGPDMSEGFAPKSISTDTLMMSGKRQ